MNNHLLRLWWLLSLLVLIAACREAPPQTPHAFDIAIPIPPLTIGLSDSAAPLEMYIRDVYPSTPDHAGLQFITGNDQTLLDQLARGELDVAIVYQQPGSENYESVMIAMDSLVIITHPDIQLQGIGLQTLHTLYSGTVGNWSTFDQTNVPVTLYGREQGSGARTLFDALVMDGRRVSPEMLIAVHEVDMMEEVKQVPGAIGYVMMGSLADQSSLPVDNISANPETVTNQSYPLTAPIFLVTLGEPTGDLARLFSDLSSEKWQAKIGEKYGQLR